MPDPAVGYIQLLDSNGLSQQDNGNPGYKGGWVAHLPAVVSPPGDGLINEYEIALQVAGHGDLVFVIFLGNDIDGDPSRFAVDQVIHSAAIPSWVDYTGSGVSRTAFNFAAGNFNATLKDGTWTRYDLGFTYQVDTPNSAATPFGWEPSEPHIDSVLPASGYAGDTVVLTGSGFTGVTEILTAFTPDVFTVDSDTQITAVLAADATATLVFPVVFLAGAAYDPWDQFDYLGFRSPVNDNFADAAELDLVGQRRTIRTVHGTTLGATAESGEPNEFSGTSATGIGTVWFKVVVPAGTTGVFRIAIPNPSVFPNAGWYYTAAVLWRQRGSGFAGLQLIDSSTNAGIDGLHNNCEGYAQGRDNNLWEYAFGAGELYYIQVATYSNVDTVGADFTLEWTYDPVDEPTIVVGTKESSKCPGTPLTTHGLNIAYYNAIHGYPARFLAGRSMAYTPSLPADGHAFYVEDVREFRTVHIRRLIVGWTPTFGPFFYGYLDPHGWLRTWTVDNEDSIGPGAADMVGGVHQGIVFYDNPTNVAELATIRSIPGEGSPDPTESWAAPLPGSLDMAWGGPGRPSSIFGAVFPSIGSSYTVEWDLGGNVVQTVPLRSFQWCSLDGTELFGLSSGDLVAYNLATTATRTVRAGTSGTIVGVRASTGEIVMSYTTTQNAVIDPATGVQRLLTLPDRPSTWAITNGRFWNMFGVTVDGLHLFFGLFYPLTPNPGGGVGSRDFVFDMWWMDLDTGTCERKFMLVHPFHDTYMLPDVVPPIPTTNVRDVRLYRQADVGR